MKDEIKMMYQNRSDFEMNLLNFYNDCFNLEHDIESSLPTQKSELADDLSLKYIYDYQDPDKEWEEVVNKFIIENMDEMLIWINSYHFGNIKKPSSDEIFRFVAGSYLAWASGIDDSVLSTSESARKELYGSDERMTKNMEEARRVLLKKESPISKEPHYWWYGVLDLILSNIHRKMNYEVEEIIDSSQPKPKKKIFGLF